MVTNGKEITSQCQAQGFSNTPAAKVTTSYPILTQARESLGIQDSTSHLETILQKLIHFIE